MKYLSILTKGLIVGAVVAFFLHILPRFLLVLRDDAAEARAVSLLKDRATPEFVNDLNGCRLYRYVADGYPHYFTTCPCQGEKP